MAAKSKPEKKAAPDHNGKQPLALQKMVPNMLTITALCIGMTSIQFAINERWEAAVLAIITAGFIDAFDGAAARLLKAQSQFGAELDSLSDFICFGACPAIVIYLWSLEDIGRFGWMVSLIFTVAVALRLARFNANMKAETTDKQGGGYFVGVPAPMGAGMALLPMAIGFLLDNNFMLAHPMIMGGWLLFFAAMMVSRVPTFSTKQVKLPQKVMIPALAAFGLMIAGLINAPWPTLTFIGVSYLVSLPIGIIRTQKTLKKD